MNDKDVMRTVVNRVAAARGLEPPWPGSDAELPEWLTNTDVSGWGVVELGEARIRLASKRMRDANGMVYTPPEVVDFMTRASMQAANLDRLAGNPMALNYITIVDPACGPGIYLIHGARYVARWYAAQLAGAEPADWMIRVVMPRVMTECFYGIDLDPVAIDLARAACWLEVDGALPFTFMDDNIVEADTFAEDLPRKAPKFSARWEAASGAAVGVS
jgi:type I restriction-modification system DNA methylase subunit